MSVERKQEKSCKICSKRLIIVHGFWLKIDFGQKAYHMKGHLKRNRMTQISASEHLLVRSKSTDLDFGQNALL